MISDLFYRLRAIFRWARVEDELNAELEFHLEQETNKYLRAGKSQAEAHRLARLNLQGPEQTKERCRDARGVRPLEIAAQDIRQAIRQMLKSPLFTLCVVLTFALCIGANTAVYSIVDALFFRPMPYPHPNRLVLLATYRGGPELDTALDGFQLQTVRDHASLLDTAAYAPILGANLSTSERARYIHQQRISASLFRVLGVPLQIGREFTRGEDVPNGPPLAVISDRLWQHAFNRSANVLGKSVAVNGTRYSIIGVAAPQFRAIPVSDFGTLEEPDVYTPLHPTTDGEGSGDNYGVLARLQRGATISQANAQLKTLTPYIASAKGLRKDQLQEERVLPLQAGLVYDIRTGIRVIWAAVICVLVLGCVNIAGMLLARSSARMRELAVRAALGAGRLRIVATLLIESTMLGLFGTIVGILIGRMALGELVRFNPGEFTLMGAVALNGRVLMVTIAASFAASLLFGLLPAIQASRVDLQITLAKGGRTSAGQRRGSARYLLVFAEVALAVMLITAAGLFVRNFLGVISPYPGFNPKGLVVASASLADPRYAQPVTAARLFRDSTSLMERIPGVESAAVAMAAPYTRPINEGLSELNGRPLNSGVEINYVTPSYFQTLGLRCMAGRTLRAADDTRGPRVVVVNDRFVEMYSPHTAIVGSTLKLEGKTWTIAGVVNSVQENNHLNGTLPLSFYPEAYVPVEQFPAGLLAMANQWFPPVWLVRTKHTDVAVQNALEAALQAVDPSIAFAEISAMESVRAKALGPVRYRTWVVSLVSALAMLLAGIGLYGVIAQAVTERRREMGLRMALGASINRIITTCIAPTVMAALAGLTSGLAAAFFAAHLLRNMIWNVSITDPASYVAGFLLLALLISMASVGPVLRLTRISPARILHED